MADEKLSTIKLDLNLPFKTFNVNEGVPDSGEGINRMPSLNDSMLMTVHDYANYWQILAKSKGGFPALIKDFMNVPPATQSFGRMSFMPTNTSGQLGVLQWPGLPPASLQKLAREMIAVNMIINIRETDIMRYADISDQPWRPGWKIVPVDPTTEIDDSIRRDIKKAQDFVLNSGYGTEFTDPIYRDDLGRPSFSKFLLEIVRDSLTYDGIAVWVDRAENGKILSYAPLPAHQIRLLARPDKAQISAVREGELNFYGATSFAGQKPAKINTDNVGNIDFAVVVDETGNIVQTYTREQLIWYVRNPRVDAEVSNYGYPEMEQALTLITGFNNAIQFNCYSEDTEVLTKIGWKLFKDVDIDIDEFVTLNKETNEIEYQKSAIKIWKPYEGKMYHITSRSLDMLVTPEHKVLLTYYDKAVNRFKQQKNTITSAGQRIGRPPKEYGYEVLTAEEVYSKFGHRLSDHWQIPVTGNWQGIEIKDKIFNGNVDNTIIMSGDDYCAFMGMYLSEGCVGGESGLAEKFSRTVIYQFSKSKGYQPYKELINKITKKEPKYIKDREFNINNVQLAEYLSQFGSLASNKFIPTEILNATPKQIKLFWDYFEMGDGSSRENCGGEFKTSKRGRFSGVSHKIGTTSKKMADQLQELAMKMGYSANIWIDTERVNKEPYYFKDSHNTQKCIQNQNTYYEIYLKSCPSHAFNMEVVDNYVGNIGCVSVPNHTVYVRRNNKVCFSQQSDIFDKNSIPKGILAIKGNFTQRQFDALGRIWDNMQRGNRTDWTLPALQLSEKGSIEIISLEELRKEPAYYNNLINLFMGALATLYGVPVHRLGYKISGTERDSRPDTPKSLQTDEDTGLPALLTHIEIFYNSYLLSNRWPHLKLVFTGKSPKEDARLYEQQTLAMTWNEKRHSVGLSRIEDVMELEEDYDELVARLMGNAPVDPGMAGIYQSMIAALAKGGAFGGVPEGEGGAGDGKAPKKGKGKIKTPGARFPSKKDPAISEDHGHMSGVRRDSKTEKHKDYPKLRRRTESYATPDKMGYTGSKGP